MIDSHKSEVHLLFFNIIRTKLFSADPTQAYVSCVTSGPLAQPGDIPVPAANKTDAYKRHHDGGKSKNGHIS